MFGATRLARSHILPEMKFGAFTAQNIASGKVRDLKSMTPLWKAIIMESGREDILFDRIDFEPYSAHECFHTLRVARCPVITLERVTFAESRISSFIPTLFNAVSSNDSIERLEINQCQLGDQEAEDIADYMRYLDISELDLSCNQIGISGAKKLIDAMTPRLKLLVLDNNRLSQQDYKSLNSDRVCAISST